MLSQSSLSLTSTNVEESIGQLAALGKVAELKKRFEKTPDDFFTSDDGINALSHARMAERNSATMGVLNRLADQYAADKLARGDWNMLVKYFTSMARYHNTYNDVSQAITMQENALFYFDKMPSQSSDKAETRLEMLQELLEYCDLDLQNLEDELPLTESADRMFSAQRQLAVLAQIIQFDMENEEKAEYQEQFHVTTYNIIALRYDLATDLLGSATELFQKVKIIEDVTEKNRYIVEATSHYYDVLFYCNDGLENLKKIPVDPDQNLPLLENLTKKFQELLKKAEALGQEFSMGDKFNKLYVRNRLYDIASDRNQGQSNINDFLDECKIENVNELVDGSQSTTQLGAAISSGSLESVIFLVENEMPVNIFPNRRDASFVTLISKSTTPAVREYILNIEGKLYQNNPHKDMIGFFIDAMLGRLDKIKDRLAKDPDSIILMPEAPYESFNILYWAHISKQRHVVKFLENYCNKYILECIHNKSWKNLKSIYQAYSNFLLVSATADKHLNWLIYQTYRCKAFEDPESKILAPQLSRQMAKHNLFREAEEPLKQLQECIERAYTSGLRAEVVLTNDILDQCILIFTAAIENIKKIPQEQTVDTDENDIHFYQYELMHFLYRTAVKFENHGQREETEKHLALKQALNCYQKAIKIAADIDMNKIAKILRRYTCLELIIREKDKVETKYKSLLAAQNNSKSSVAETFGQAKSPFQTSSSFHQTVAMDTTSDVSEVEEEDKKENDNKDNNNKDNNKEYRLSF